MTNEEIRESLYDAISSIETLCSFAVGGIANNLPLPGLSVEGAGNILLPLQETQINAIITASEQAPFGKGAHTVVDTAVRNCRQVDASKVTLGVHWQNAIQQLARESASSLGVYGFNVVSSLYKLIVYPPGGFFKAHKDTEKEAGMFATLVVQLPSKFEGGSLVVSHMGEKKVFDFTQECESQFYSAAFYGDCDHELQTVKNGHRVCLIYNLLRTDNGPVPSLAEQDGTINQIIKAADEWESANASHSPRKFALLLEHKYTDKNLAFRLLKGTDASIVSVLRLTRRFDLHLALVEKYQRGAAESSFQEHHRFGDWSDNEGAHYSMDTEIESSIDVKKWVAENDVPVSLKGIRIDEEGDMLDGEYLFGDDEDPDREEYEGYTGNAGPTVEYWYHRAVLVIWPKSRSMTIICSGSFAGGVQLALRRAQEQDPSAEASLQHIISFAKNHPVESQARLAEVLEVACLLRHSNFVCDILHLMARDVVPSCAGCCSVKHTQLFVDAVNLFGWEELQKRIVSAIEATSARNVGNCARLARMFAKSPETFEAADTVAKVSSRIFLATGLEDSAAARMASVLFSFKSCSEDKKKFLSRREELSAGAISEVIRHVCKMGSGTTELNGFPEGFAELVQTYNKKALRKKVVTESCQHGAIVWSILLGPQPRDDDLLDQFSKATLETNCAICVHPSAPEVTEFLRGDRVSMEYYGFTGIGHARNFSYKHFSGGYNSTEKQSARAVPQGRGGAACVIITKTNAFYNALLQQYRADQEELTEVKKFLGRSPTRVAAHAMENSTSGSGRNAVGDVVDLTVE